MTRIDELLDEAAPAEPVASRAPRARLRVLVIGATVAIVLVVNAVIALGGGGLSDAVSVDDRVVPTGDPVAVLDVEFIELDVSRGVQEVLVLPIPQTDSGLFGSETRLVVERDGLPPAIFTFAPDETIFPAQFEVAAVGGRNDYPWDSYQSQMQVSMDAGRPESALPIEATVDTSLSGWRIDTVLTNTGTDTITATTQTSRSFGPILLAASQFVSILAVGLLLAAVTFDNLYRRHAAFGSVSACLSSLLLLSVIRTLMPGRPPVGIRLDFASTYPALFIATVALMSLVVLFLSEWIRTRLRGEVPGGSMTFG